MRLDKYLKVSRLIKRRTVAKEACGAGKVSVNGKVSRASVEVKVDDIIEIRIRDRVIKAQVLRVAQTAYKDEAAGLYKIIS